MFLVAIRRRWQSVLALLSLSLLGWSLLRLAAPEDRASIAPAAIPVAASTTAAPVPSAAAPSDRPLPASSRTTPSPAASQPDAPVSATLLAALDCMHDPSARPAPDHDPNLDRVAGELLAKVDQRGLSALDTAETQYPLVAHLLLPQTEPAPDCGSTDTAAALAETPITHVGIAMRTIPGSERYGQLVEVLVVGH